MKNKTKIQLISNWTRSIVGYLKLKYILTKRYLYTVCTADFMHEALVKMHNIGLKVDHFFPYFVLVLLIFVI